MSESEGWQHYREWLFDDGALGFRLDVSRSGLDAAFVERMAAPMTRAFEEMRALEAGALANPDEGRRVGHYWLRAPKLAPDESTRRAIEAARDDVLAFADRVRGGSLPAPCGQPFESYLLVGIGGSALGPQFVAEALGNPGDRLRPHFLDNTDPDGIARVLDGIGDGLGRTLTIVVSKSGGTPETRNGMLEAAARYRVRGLDFGAHAVAVTQAGSKLDRFAEERGFVARFPMWDWVGGRTSEFSAVGLLPAALQGFDVRAMLAGAAAMDERTRVGDSRRNPAALMALVWHLAGDGRGARDMVILPYKDRLALISRYLQQLVMESLGKERDLDGNVVHQGLAVYGNKGSTDQHAYVQQLRDGIPNFFVTFVEVLEDGGEAVEVEPGVTSGDFLHGFLQGTRRALWENGRPSMTITVRDVSARTVGMLVALFERAVGLYAGLIRVNAYHQPGVEAGKKAAAAVLDLRRRLVDELDGAGEALDCETLAERIGADDQVETVLKLLEHLAANPRNGVVQTPADRPWRATFRKGSI